MQLPISATDDYTNDIFVPAKVPLLGALLSSVFLCGWMLVAFLVSTEQMSHWFVIPVFVCGVLIGIDGVRALRGQLDIFGPIGFVGIVGLHFFFLAPLLHVRWDYWLQYIPTAGVDWRHWLGLMAILNILGLCFYFLVRNLFYRQRPQKSDHSRWQLNDGLFTFYGTVALLLTAALQTIVYIQFGGISGFLNAREARDGSFEGYGVIFMVSESFPIVAMIMFVVWAKKKPSRQTWLLLFCALLLFVVAKLLFGGLRGSRGAIIWALYWAVGLIHLWLRPIPKKVIYIGAVGVILFMYAYSFYKTLGTDAIEIFQEQGNVAALEQESGRSFEGVVLGDLARSDIQAYLLYRLSPKPEGVDYEYALGATYLGAVEYMIPSFIWPGYFPTKVEAGTEALYGVNSSEYRTSTRAYGLAGEAMLNFGIFAVPVAYGIFGALVAVVQKWQDRLREGDPRLLLVPFVTVWVFYGLVWDSDNIVIFLFKNGLIPSLIVFFAATRGRVALTDNGSSPSSRDGTTVSQDVR